MLGLNAVLLDEFSTESRRSYADLLGALGRAAHPEPEATPAPTAAWSAVTRLCECLNCARTLAAPEDAVRARFPLSNSGPIRLIDSLLALASYSESPPAHSEQVGLVLRQLTSEAEHVSAGSKQFLPV